MFIVPELAQGKTVIDIWPGERKQQVIDPEPCTDPSIHGVFRTIGQVNEVMFVINPEPFAAEDGLNSHRLVFTLVPHCPFRRTGGASYQGRPRD